MSTGTVENQCVFCRVFMNCNGASGGHASPAMVAPCGIFWIHAVEIGILRAEFKREAEFKRVAMEYTLMP